MNKNTKIFQTPAQIHHNAKAQRWRDANREKYREYQKLYQRNKRLREQDVKDTSVLGTPKPSKLHTKRARQTRFNREINHQEWALIYKMLKTNTFENLTKPTGNFNGVMFTSIGDKISLTEKGHHIVNLCLENNLL